MNAKTTARERLLDFLAEYRELYPEAREGTLPLLAFLVDRPRDVADALHVHAEYALLIEYIGTVTGVPEACAYTSFATWYFHQREERAIAKQVAEYKRLRREPPEECACCAYTARGLLDPRPPRGD